VLVWDAPEPALALIARHFPLVHRQGRLAIGRLGPWPPFVHPLVDRSARCGADPSVNTAPRSSRVRRRRFTDDVLVTRRSVRNGTVVAGTGQDKRAGPNESAPARGWC